jgi:hypothetical protein
MESGCCLQRQRNAARNGRFSEQCLCKPRWVSWRLLFVQWQSLSSGSDFSSQGHVSEFQKTDRQDGVAWFPANRLLQAPDHCFPQPGMRDHHDRDLCPRFCCVGSWITRACQEVKHAEEQSPNCHPRLVNRAGIARRTRARGETKQAEKRHRVRAYPERLTPPRHQGNRPLACGAGDGPFLPGPCGPTGRCSCEALTADRIRVSF